MLEGRADGRDLIAESTHFPAGPCRRPKFADLDLRSCPSVREHFRRADAYRDRRFVEERFGDEFIPVDVDYAFVGLAGAGRQADAVSQFVHGKSPESLLAERQPMISAGSPAGVSLLLAVVVTGDKPDRSQEVERHAFAVVEHRNRRFRPGREIETYDDPGGIGVVGVLDQLEDRQPRAADQLVAEQLQHPGGPPRGRKGWLTSLDVTRSPPAIAKISLSPATEHSTHRMLAGTGPVPSRSVQSPVNRCSLRGGAPVGSD